MTELVTVKSTGLTKTGEAVRHLATRLERARQSRNEKVSRADAEYVEAVRRALASVEDTPADQAVAEKAPAEPATMNPAS
jgi:hypothetical protein